MKIFQSLGDFSQIKRISLKTKALSMILEPHKRSEMLSTMDRIYNYAENRLDYAILNETDKAKEILDLNETTRTTTAKTKLAAI